MRYAVTMTRTRSPLYGRGAHWLVPIKNCPYGRIDTVHLYEIDRVCEDLVRSGLDAILLGIDRINVPFRSVVFRRGGCVSMYRRYPMKGVSGGVDMIDIQFAYRWCGARGLMFMERPDHILGFMAG